ncbi:putative rhamnosyltransferase [Gelidibacter algens]|uniref:Putative rhamnosyltransferase n=1 Tax=Gelidibacter algens TaxID=49280 RepID=A0A1A7R1H7_9FLAO|nr:glycosyltransferase [Gelidibacter algens]OBX25334.1 hypothetical protein A9996_10315 [Gelidibacter algens]RAJ25201.1 putative rhamnosyltransferase [Gelidibacter algens]
MFQHFLITRFNLKLEEWQTTKKGEPVVSEAWLKNRFELFNTYCLPSVTQQTNQNFKWLVCFDSETPDVFKTKVSEISHSYPNFKPLYLSASTNIIDVLTAEIKLYLTSSDTHIITTRMDNDDALHKSFIETIQRAFKSQDPFIVDAVRGFQFIPGKKSDVVRIMNVAYNPFLSFVEYCDNFQTILSRPHLEWHDTQHVILNTQPLWMQVIHDQNISNAEKLNFPETNDFCANNFGNPKTKLKSEFAIRLSTIWSFFKRVLIKLKIVSLL